MRFLLLVLAMVFAPVMATGQAMAQPWKPAHGEKLAFDVLRDGGALGTHVVSFARDGDTLTVKTAVELKVAFGPLTLFDYAHDVTEKYLRDKLTWVGSRTKKDGKWKTLSAEAVEGGIDVKGAKFKGLLKGMVIPSTHWNADEMKQAAMFSTEPSKPILKAATCMSSSTRRAWSMTHSGSMARMSSTPAVSWAVMAVITDSA